MSKSRSRIFIKGLGNLEVMEVYPTSPVSFASVGYLKQTQVQDEPSMTEVRDETGALVTAEKSSQTVTVSSNLLQPEKSNIDLIRHAEDVFYAVRYHGKAQGTNIYQYWCFEKAKITPKVALSHIAGERTLPILITAMLNDDYDSVYDIPVYYLWEGYAEIDPTGCELWLDAKLGLNADTVYALDISGYARHGVLNASTVWQAGTPLHFWRFDGTDDYMTLGDVLDDNGTYDMVFMAWLRVQGADGTQQEILGKKSAIGNSAGYCLYRNTSNQMAFQHGDGDSNVIVTSTATLLQNVWKHVAITIDRNGNIQLYINGVATGAAVSVASQASGTNAEALRIGNISTAFGQFDMSGIQAFRHTAGALPANIATQIANAYAAESAAHV